MFENNPKVTKLSEKITAFLSKEKIEELAKTEGFVKRKSPLTGFDFLQLSVKGIGNEGFASLTELCMKLYKDQGIEISKQGLDERFHADAVQFIKKILNKLLCLRLGECLQLQLLSKFEGIYVRDSTSTQLPACFSELFKGSGGNASKAGLKVDLTYDVKGEGITLEFRDAASNDSSSKRLDIKQGCLYLQDLGYFKISRFKNILEGKAYFISRYKLPTNLYYEKGGRDKRKDKPLKLTDLVKGMVVNEIRSKNIFLGMKERLAVRLVIQKLPKEAVEKRKRRLKADMKRKGRQPSKIQLAFCQYSIMITNIDSDMLSDEEIINLYTVRWQIEIMFKCWKSIMKFGEIHPMKANRFLCMLYGHMIWIVLCMKLTQFFKSLCWKKYNIQLSELKLFKMMVIYQNDFCELIKENEKKYFEILFTKMLCSAFLFAEKEERKNKPNRLFSIV